MPPSRSMTVFRSSTIGSMVFLNCINAHLPEGILYVKLEQRSMAVRPLSELPDAHSPPFPPSVGEAKLILLFQYGIVRNRKSHEFRKKRSSSVTLDCEAKCLQFG